MPKQHPQQCCLLIQRSPEAEKLCSASDMVTMWLRQRDEVQLSFDSIQTTTARLLSQMEANKSAPGTVCNCAMYMRADLSTV